MISKFQSLALFLILYSINLSAQTTEQPKLVIKPILALQLWGTYTDGQQVYSASNQQFEPVDNRLNFLLHRSRAGIKGSYGNQWVYDFTSSLDFVGQDALAGTVGGNNNGASPSFRIWNALVQYKIKPTSEALYFTVGYMTPLMSRESITSPFAVGAFEKAWSQNYIRRHVTGTGPGRIVGSNLGGFFQGDRKKIAFDYNLGIFNPRLIGFNGTSAGRKFSPLLTYRLAIHIGDPESTKYSRGHKFNYKGQRNGATLVLSGSRQGASDLWESNTSFGVDLLANFGNLNLAGEWMKLDRELGSLNSSATTGFLKAGYYLPLSNGKELEPVLTYVFLDGPTSASAQQNASTLGTFSGKDSYFEITLNYYVSNKVRLSLAYTLRDGEEGTVPATELINNYFQQGGIGTITRGNYLGIGLLFTI